MHTVRFDSSSHGGDLLRLGGRFVQGRVSLLPDGVWRLLAYSRSEDETKGSWVLPPLPRLPFRVDPDGGALVLSAAGAPALRLELDPLRFTFGDDPRVTATTLMARRTRIMADARYMHDLATGQGDPLAETVDGLPFGAGLHVELADPVARRWYGLGERTGFLDKRGRVWTNHTTDQSRHLPTADPLYQAHPFVMGMEDGRAFGLYLDESWRTVFDLACSEPERTTIHTDGPTFDLYLIPGPTPRDVLSRYTALTGRASMPALWTLGYHQCRWSYPDSHGVRALAKDFAAHDIPLDALWLDIDHMDGYRVFSFSQGRFPDPRAMTEELRAQGTRTVVIVDPGVKREPGYAVYEQGKKLDAFVKDRREDELVGEVWPSPAVWPDFLREDVRAWWGELHRFYLERGVAGIWCDMNEPAAFGTPGKTLPPGARHGRHWHAEVHNLYGQMMSRATHEALAKARPDERPFVLTRSGFAGIQRWAFVWTGDNASFWEHLEGSLPMLLNLGLSGVPFVGADVGGFAEDTTGELLVRWMWMGALYPFFRNHAGKGTRRQEPWSFGEPWTSHARAAVRFRHQLVPYLYTLAREAVDTGMPPLRPMMLEYPEDPETWALHDQVLLGRDLLAAPALRPGQTRRLVYLPAGSWVDVWTGESHVGPTCLTVPTPLDRIPMFQRAGTAIPLRRGPSPLRDARWPELVWQVALAHEIRGSVFEDAGDGPTDQGTRSDFSATYDGSELSVSWVDRAGLGERRVLVDVLGKGAPLRASTSHRFDGRALELVLSGPSLTAAW